MVTESASKIDFRPRPLLDLLGFGLPILAVVALAFFSTNLGEARQDASSWVVHTQKVQTDLNTVLSLLQDMETGQRGYLLTGNIEYLSPFDSASSSLDSELLDLRLLTSDNSEQRDRFRILTALVDDKRTELQVTIDTRTTDGFEAALAIVNTDSGKIFMDEIRDVIGQIGEVEDGLLAIRQNEVEDLRSVTANLYWSVVVLITIFSTFLLFRLRSIRKTARSAIRTNSELLASKATN